MVQKKNANQGVIELQWTGFVFGKIELKHRVKLSLFKVLFLKNIEAQYTSPIEN